MASSLGGGPRRLSAFRVLVALVFAGPIFAGCGDKGFFVDVPLWKAGYGWEYDEYIVDTESLKGELPSIIDEDAETNVNYQNNTVRLEVFNATAASVEGIPIYALAVLNKYYPEDNETPPDSVWDAWVFSADINKVEPTYLDWRNQEIQLSGNEGEDQPDETDDSGGEPALSLLDRFLLQDEEESGLGGEEQPRPEFEDRRLDWPLEKGHEWRHPEPVPLLGGADGVFEAKAVRTYSQKVPAGTFSAVRIEGKLTADDLSEQEEDVRTSLEAFGGEVDNVNVNYVTSYTYGYSSEVLNVVYYQQVDRYSIHARGEDGDGQKYDFTFSKEVKTTRELFTYSLVDGLEKPLTFALDVKRGAYEPKPITAASHLAVEIITSQEALNKAGDESVHLGLRIYNSTAGEKKLRGPESNYAAFGQPFSPNYDHDLLEIRWTIHDILPNNAGIGPETEVFNQTGDTHSLRGDTFERYGLKTVTATLKLKDTPEGEGQSIFTDIVLFEVYMRTNMTGKNNATNTPPTNVIRVPFPVEHTATRVTIVGRNPAVPPEGECPIGISFTPCVDARDGGNRDVVDDRGEPMIFETTRLSNYIKGTWNAIYNPAHPDQSITFEITVRYRAGE